MARPRIRTARLWRVPPSCWGKKGSGKERLTAWASSTERASSPTVHFPLKRTTRQIALRLRPAHPRTQQSAPPLESDGLGSTRAKRQRRTSHGECTGWCAGCRASERRVCDLRIA
eukprot:69526-Rhodomonas_salina.2